MRENWRIIGIGYCNAERLLHYETLKDYNDRANKIIFDYSSEESHDEKKSKVRELLREFVKYAITNKGDSPE